MLLALVLTVAACGSTTPTATPSTPPSVGPSAATTDRCATAPEPASMEGWEALSQAPTAFPSLITNPLLCGPSRILISLLDKDNVPVAGPDRPLKAAFFDLAKDLKTPVTTVDGTFAWAIEGSRGFYIFDVDLPEAGTYGIEFTTQAPGGPPETIRVTSTILPGSSTVKVGDPAPASKTPTAGDVGGDLSKISTDAKPDPAFYTRSVADALAAHTPFILVFATPKFCTSAQCGPTLDDLKPIAAAHPEVTFINVEPYILEDASGQLQPVLDAQGNLQATDVTNAWGLTSEPWIFAVDGTGVVRKSYELIATAAEMDAAIAAIAPGG
jgi:hypothetical protein